MYTMIILHFTCMKGHLAMATYLPYKCGISWCKELINPETVIRDEYDSDEDIDSSNLKESK